jgi:hypothetical protein
MKAEKSETREEEMGAVDTKMTLLYTSSLAMQEWAVSD